MEKEIEEESPQLPPSRGRHIKKRALKNKALTISFNEKDLKDYVTGFHKRKKKRRKEAQRQQEEALRRKRIEIRKNRKLEKELALYGGAPPTTNSASNDEVEYDESVDDSESDTLVNGTTLYDNEDVKVTVTTSVISREDEDTSAKRTLTSVPMPVTSDKKHSLPGVKSKSFKKVSKPNRLRTKNKVHSKRSKAKGKKKNKKR